MWARGAGAPAGLWFGAATNCAFLFLRVSFSTGLAAWGVGRGTGQHVLMDGLVWSYHWALPGAGPGVFGIVDVREWVPAMDPACPAHRPALGRTAADCASDGIGAFRRKSRRVHSSVVVKRGVPGARGEAGGGGWLVAEEVAAGPLGNVPAGG